jgi:hypothetical protein
MLEVETAICMKATTSLSADGGVTPSFSPLFLCRIFGHQPQKTGGLKAVLCINFLNNSSSSWEVMMEPWPVEVLLSNPINRMFKDRRTT